MKVHEQSIQLEVSVLKEGNKFIAYSPALDLSACGDTLDEAKDGFDETLRIFMKELIKMGTLEEVLLDCGWEKVSHKKNKCKTWSPPIHVASINEEIRIPCPV